MTVDHARAAKGLDVRVCRGPEQAVAGARVIVGAGPTGGTVPAHCVASGAVVVDVAIPATIVGRPDPSVRVLAGEAVSFPAHWQKGFWGWLYHVLSGYGPNQVYACLIEPLVLALSARRKPYSIGRNLRPDDVADFGRSARELGFAPRLAQGWSALDIDALPRG